MFHGPEPLAGGVMVARTRVYNIWAKHGWRGCWPTICRLKRVFRDAGRDEPKGMRFSESVVPEDTPQETRATSTAFIGCKNEHNEFMAIARKDLSGLQPGGTPRSITIPLYKLTECVRGQVTTGSRAAGHNDSPAAQTKGSPGWFGVGMYHAGLRCYYVVVWPGVEPLRRFMVRFRDDMARRRPYLSWCGQRGRRSHRRNHEKPRSCGGASVRCSGHEGMGRSCNSVNRRKGAWYG